LIDIEWVIEDLAKSEVQQSWWNEVFRIKRFRYKGFSVSSPGLVWRLFATLRLSDGDLFPLTEKFSQVVLGTEEGSPADKVGFQEGDVILEIKGKRSRPPLSHRYWIYVPSSQKKLPAPETPNPQPFLLGVIPESGDRRN